MSGRRPIVQHRRHLAVLLAVLPILGGGCGGSATPRQPAGAAAELLPDMVQRVPGGLAGRTLETTRGTRFLLGFTSAVDNAGAGPLLVDGHRPSRARPTMVAEQIVMRSDGSRRTIAGVGRLRYVRASNHQHWHLLGFDTYEMRSVGKRAARRDRKSGFCLGDRYETDPMTTLPAEPPKPVWTRECGRNQPRLLAVREGISVGYGDDYPAQLEGQYVDITRLPAGEYDLVHRVNADRRLVESDYANDVSSLRFRLRWPRGMQAPPRIDVLARCKNTARCGT